MAGNAVIGALRVNLGLDSAQFSSGLKKAEGGLARFGKLAGIGLAAVATAAVSAGIALGHAVKGAADHADELGKTAQKVGVSVEALSRLEYAAKLSDVSLEGLSTGLRKLADNMATVAQNSNAGVATAFKALGISVKDAAGNLKSGDVVLAEVADRFSRMEDGALKTSLAIQIFGKAGADLIPLLNSGKTGLAEMAAEADRLGVTVSTKTAKSAEVFNDNITRLSAVLEGLANKVMVGVIDSLADLTNTMASSEFQTAIVNTANAIMGIANALADGVKWANALLDVLPKAVAAGEDKALYANLPGYDAFIAQHEVGRGGGDGVGGGAGSFDAMLAKMGVKSATTTTPTTPPFKPIITDAGAAKKALIELTDTGDKYTDSAQRMTEAIGNGLGNAFSRLADAVLSGNDALSATVDVLMDLGKQLVSSAIQGFFGNLFSGALSGGMGLGSGAIGRSVYGGNTGFFPGFPGMASGGTVGRGGMTWVGEKGPELLNLPRGSQVIPNHELGSVGQSAIRVDLGPGLVATILKQAGEQSVQIVQSQAPLAVAKFSRNRMGG